MGEARSFLEDVAFVYEGDDCLTWPYATIKGYGNVFWRGKNRIAARVVCEHANGPAPSGAHHAAHSCGRGHLGCVAKHHLSWKSPLENNADKAVHGTNTVGEKSSLSKLTSEQVCEIRQLAKLIPQKDIAPIFGVAASNISMIVSGKTWKHVDAGERVPGAELALGEDGLMVRTK